MWICFQSRAFPTRLLVMARPLPGSSSWRVPYPAPRRGASPTRLLIGVHAIPSSSSGRVPYPVPRRGASPTRFLTVAHHPVLFLHSAYPTPHLPLPLVDTLWDRPSSLLFTAGSQLPGRCLVHVRCFLSRCGAPGRG